MATPYTSSLSVCNLNGKNKNIETTKSSMKINHFKKWKLGTINIRSGKEKSYGSKIYRIAKEVARAGLSICCLQEVRYRNIGDKIIALNTGEKFRFMWCGMKKRREAGVGLMVKVDPEITVSEPDVSEPRVMAVNIKLFGFNLRVITCYSPTNIDGSPMQKDNFYRTVRKAITKKKNTKKLSSPETLMHKPA